MKCGVIFLPSFARVEYAVARLSGLVSNVPSGIDGSSFICSSIPTFLSFY